VITIASSSLCKEEYSSLFPVGRGGLGGVWIRTNLHPFYILKAEELMFDDLGLTKFLEKACDSCMPIRNNTAKRKPVHKRKPGPLVVHRDRLA